MGNVRASIAMPTKERFAKGDMELVEFDPLKLSVEKGGGAVRAQTKNYFMTLYDKGVILKKHLTALESFQFHFNRAGLVHYTTLNLFRVQGGKKDFIDAMTGDQITSRSVVKEVCVELSPLLASLLWECVGLERPVQSWVLLKRAEGHNFTRHDARGLLIAALDHLTRLERFKQR